MKRGLKVLFGLVCLFVIGLPAFAQPSSKSISTFIMDGFDSAEGQNYMCDGVSYGWDWAVESSRFVAEGFPKTGYFEGAPNSLKQLMKGQNNDDLKVFGVNTAFNRKGDNWFEVFPVKDGEAFEIPFIGNVDHFDFWVWGANYNYNLEVLVRDAFGKVHVLKAGNLCFQGWKNIVVKIPVWLKQKSPLRSGPKHMTLVGFRIRSDAEEFVDNFTIFFDQIKYTTNALSNIYDGYDLNEVDFGDSNGSSNSSNSASNEVTEK